MLLNIGFFFVCEYKIYSQNSNVSWNYPVKPGTEAWSNLKTEDERFKAMNIPEDILNNISTSELVKTCLNLPAFGYFTAFNNFQEGFVILATKFNGLAELANRNDGFIYLMKIYENAGEEGFISEQPGIEEEYWPIRFIWIELLLAQNKILMPATHDDKSDLMKICLEKYYLKQQSDKYSFYSTSASLFLMARIMQADNFGEFVTECKENDALDSFFHSSEMEDEKIPEILIELAFKYLNS
jgi:hypothetical protein